MSFEDNATSFHLEHHQFSTCAKFSEKLTCVCANQAVINVSFSEPFAHTLNGWFPVAFTVIFYRQVFIYVLFIKAVQRHFTTTSQKWSLRISSVNVTKSTVSCGLGHIYWGNPLWKLHFLCIGPFWFLLLFLLILANFINTHFGVDIINKLCFHSNGDL